MTRSNVRSSVPLPFTNRHGRGLPLVAQACSRLSCCGSSLPTPTPNLNPTLPKAPGSWTGSHPLPPRSNPPKPASHNSDFNFPAPNFPAKRLVHGVTHPLNVKTIPHRSPTTLPSLSPIGGEGWGEGESRAESCAPPALCPPQPNARGLAQRAPRSARPGQKDSQSDPSHFSDPIFLTTFGSWKESRQLPQRSKPPKSASAALNFNFPAPIRLMEKSAPTATKPQPPEAAIQHPATSIQHPSPRLSTFNPHLSTS